MNQAQQMSEALGQVDEAAPARSLRNKLDKLVGDTSLSRVLDQLGAIASQGVEVEAGAGLPGKKIIKYGQVVPTAIRKAADQAERMENQK